MASKTATMEVRLSTEEVLSLIRREYPELPESMDVDMVEENGKEVVLLTWDDERELPTKTETT